MSETVKNWLWYTFYGVCVLVLVVIGVYTSVLMSNRNKLKTEIEKARKRGDLMTLSELEDAYKRRVSNTRSYPSDFDNFKKQFDLFSDSQPEKWKDLTQHVMKSGPGLKKQMQEWDSDKREQKIQKLVRFTGHYQVEIDQLLSKRYPPAEVNFYKEPGSSGLSLRGRSYFVSFYAFLQLLSGNTKEVRPALAWLFENANIRFKEPIRSPFWNGMDLRDGGYWLIRELLQQDQVATKTLREVKRLLNNHPNLKTVYRKRFREEVSANFWWLHGVMTNDKQVLKHAGPIPFSFTLVRPWLFGKISDSLRNYHQWLNLLRKRYPLVKKKWSV